LRDSAGLTPASPLTGRYSIGVIVCRLEEIVNEDDCHKLSHDKESEKY
jgi:hypothetical protein